MRSFLKSIFYFLLPAILMFLIYVISDPFDVFFYEPSIAEQNKVGADNDYHTTENLMGFADSENYNGFVIGNSRSTAFLPKNIESVIPNSRFFNYGTPGESIRNIRDKLLLIDELQLDIDHVLILIDDNVLFNADNQYYDDKGAEYLHHPQTSSQTQLSYTYNGFKSYLHNFYFIRDWDYKLTGEYKSYMQGYIPDPKRGSGRPEGYSFPDRLEAGTESDVIGEYSDLLKLAEIKNLLKEKGTDYRIIIPPSYFQKRFNQENLLALHYVFGADKVFDFTGVNEFSNDINYFHEESHFNVELANLLLSEIYAQ